MFQRFSETFSNASLEIPSQRSKYNLSQTKLVRLFLVNTFTFPRITLHVAVELPFHLPLREKLLQIYFCSWFMSKFTSLGNDEADRNWILNTTNSMARGRREKNVFIIKFLVSVVLFLPFSPMKSFEYAFHWAIKTRIQKVENLFIEFIHQIAVPNRISIGAHSRPPGNLSKFIPKPRKQRAARMKARASYLWARPSSTWDAMKNCL